MFRRSGGTTAYFVEGKTPATDSPSFAAALTAQRFRSIETASSEEMSIGWVSPGDPTGESFLVEDMALDDAVWLRVRVDRKKLPTVWVGIHRTEAERSRGRALSARERKELRVELEQRLLPRILPSVQLVDALWHPGRKLLLLFATSNALREEFQKLFVRSFGVQLVEAGPRELAERSGIARDAVLYLNEVAPVRWPRIGEDQGALAGSDGDDGANDDSGAVDELAEANG